MTEEQQLALVQTRVPQPLLRWVEREAQRNGQSVASWLRLKLTELRKSDAPGVKLGEELQAIAKRLRRAPKAQLAEKLADALERIAEHYGQKTD